MELVFRCLDSGRKLFSVMRQGQEIFVGTEEECTRFLSLHDQKVSEERELERRPPRHAPMRAKTYRVAPPRAS
jgi:hypothetical protein